MRDLCLLTAGVVLLSGCWLFHRSPGDTERSVNVPEWLDVPDAGTALDAALESHCVERDLRAGERFEPVDMVWVVDSSRSMADEQARIEQTMNDFVRDAQARSFDVRLVMITDVNIVPPPFGSDTDRYLFVQREVGSRAPLDALLEELPRYQDFLRPAAKLHFVIVTDDESQLDGRVWRREMDRRLARPFVVHAVASPDVGGFPCRSENASPSCSGTDRRVAMQCGAAAVGRIYYALAQQSGGEQISICIDDWRDVFGPLLEAVTPTEIPCAIELETGDLGATEVEIYSGEAGVRLTQVAGPIACEGQRWSYYYVDRAEGTELSLCPQTCAETRGESIRLRIATHCEVGPE